MRLFVSLALLLLAISGDALAAHENHCSNNDANSSGQRAATSSDCGSIEATSDYPGPSASGAQKPTDDSSEETSGLALKFEDHEAWEQKKHAREHELDQPA